jgi:hypothetical protein
LNLPWNFAMWHLVCCDCDRRGIGTMDDQQGRGGTGGQGKDARQQRLKQALRDNLRRRKAQARQRDANGPVPANPDEAAIAKDAGEQDE